MKLITLLILMLAMHASAGWLNNDDQRIQDLNQQVITERQSTGSWQIVAGVLGIGAVVLFTIGTALGSKTRRDGKR